VEVTYFARELLGNLGYDPTYGARPLKRVISKRLVDPLALGLLKGDYAAGDAVLVDAEHDPPTLAFTRVGGTRSSDEAPQPQAPAAVA